MKTLVSIVGPTAVGKTALAIQLAKHLNTEIISADARQFYREMTIGTAKPSMEELTQVPHHLIDNLSIFDSYSAGEFEREALALLEKLFNRIDTVIMVGGSGLFVNAVCEGLDVLPKPKAGVREELNDAYTVKGLSYIQDLLKRYDPQYYAEVDLGNPQRIIRALEVFESTGIPFSHFRKNASKPRNFHVISIGLEIPRSMLYEKINNRVGNMIKSGLVEEVMALRPHKSLPPLLTVGYSELFDYFDGLYTLEEATGKIKQNTRRYAKRQMTWFKRNKATTWFAPDDLQGIVKHLENIPINEIKKAK